MKYKFEIDDIVQFRTQKGFFEPFQILSKGYIETSIDKQNVYTVGNSSSIMNTVCEDRLEVYNDRTERLEKLINKGETK